MENYCSQSVDVATARKLGVKMTKYSSMVQINPPFPSNGEKTTWELYRKLS